MYWPMIDTFRLSLYTLLAAAGYDSVDAHTTTAIERILSDTLHGARLRGPALGK
jgi:hypothetical protein